MKFLAILLALTGFTASAAELYLTVNGNATYFDFCNTGTYWWALPEGGSKVADEGDTCYNIYTNKSTGVLINTVRASPTCVATNYEFKGSCFKVSGNGFGMYIEPPSTLAFKDYGDNKGLLLLAGGVVRLRNTAKQEGIFRGLITVEATSSNPAKLMSTGTGVESVFHLESRVVGAASSYLSIAKYSSFTGPTAVEFLGDCSQFFGTVKTDSTLLRPRVSTGCPVFAGSILLSANGVYETVAPANAETAVAKLETLAAATEILVRATNTLTVADLKLAGGAITVETAGNAGGCLTVTSSLTVSGSPTLTVETHGELAAYDVFKVPTSFDPIEQLGIAFDDASGAVAYTVVTNGSWQILRASSKDAAVTLGATETKTVSDMAINTLAVTVGYDVSQMSAGCLTLSGTLSVEQGITVSVPAFSTSSTGNNLTGTQPRCAILKVPTGFDRTKVTLDLQATAYSGADNIGYLPRSFSSWVENEEGYDVLYIGYRPVVKRGRWEGAATEAEKKSGSITNMYYWSDTAEPHAGADYLAPYQSSASTPKGPFTMTVADSLRDANNVITFGGDSLTVAYYFELPAGGKTAEFKINGPLTLLHSRNASAFSGVNCGCGPSVDGAPTQTVTADRVELYPLSARDQADLYLGWPGFRARNGYRICLNAPLAGTDASACVLQCEAGNYAKGPIYRLLHESNSFTGRLALVVGAGSYKPVVTRQTRLEFSSPAMLGASPAQFVTNALTLADWGYLAPTAEMTLDTPNRGVLVRYHGGVTNDLAFTLGSRVTYAGEFEKQGAGVLTFACDERPMTVDDYVNRATATARGTDWVYTNILMQTPQIRISGGAVRATTTNAIDGIKTIFAGGGIRVTPDAESGSAEATYGLYDAAADDLLQTASAETKIPVSFDLTGKNPGEDLAGTICTVKNTSLTAASFSLVRPWGKSYVLSVTKTDNVDGTSTFRATARLPGAFIFLR